LGLIGRPRKIAINSNYSGEKARSVLCQSRLSFSSWSAVPNQTKPGRCFGFKQANCFGNNISSEISSRTWKPLTLRYKKIKYRGEQKPTQYLLTEEDMTRISTVNRFLTKLDIFGEQILSRLLFPPVFDFFVAQR
jgi:hypothetical protein